MASKSKDIGSTGLNQTWGYIRDDFDKNWNGIKKAETIDEMLRSASVIGALRFAIEMNIRSVDWFYESELGEDDPRIDFLDEAIKNLSISWEAHVSDALMCIFYGWSMFTETYEKVNGLWMWKKFKPLRNSTLQRWLVDDDGGLKGIQQWPHEWPDPIPIERMVIYKIRSNYGNPEGESILRPAYPDYYYVKNFKSLEGITYERFGGLPVITLPETAVNDDDFDKAEEIVANVRIDEQAGVVERPGWVFRFETPKGSPLDFDKPISRYEKRILTAALAQFLLLGQDRVGTQSLASDQTNFFNMAVNTLASIIADTHTQYSMKKLLRINGYDDTGIKLNHSPAGNADLTLIGEFLQKTGSLITWTPQDEMWLRSLGNMPEKSLQELQDLEEQVAPAPPMPQEEGDNGDDFTVTYESIFNTERV